MSFLGRIFGGKEKPPEPAPTTVVIDPELAGTLTAGGLALDVAVDGALRAYVTLQAKAAESGHADRIPFWLQRDAERSGGLEDELRDRVIQRHGAEEGRRE